MAADSYNRKTARNYLKSLLEPVLVGLGKPCEAIYGYQPATFEGQSPVVTVSSAGSERAEQGLRGCVTKDVFYIGVHVFVLYADKRNPAWTEANAEDAVDDIEKATIDLLRDNRTVANYWTRIGYDERTVLDNLPIGGDEYRHEVIPVRVEVLNG